MGCRRYALGLDLGSGRGQGRLDRSVRFAYKGRSHWARLWASQDRARSRTSMLQELDRTGSNEDQNAQSNEHERDDPMRLSASRHAKGSLVYEPMSGKTPQTCHKVRRQSANKNFHGIDTPAEVPITMMSLGTMGFCSVVSPRYASGNAADPIPLELFEIALRAKKAF